MTAELFAHLFLVAVLFSSGLRLWLSWRHWHHVKRHEDAVPAAFAAHISLAEHRKAAAYTQAKMRSAMAELGVDTLWLLLLTLGGGLAWIDAVWREALGAGHVHGLLLFASVGVLSTLVGLPFDLYRVFGIEAQFGFNKTTPQLWLIDFLKGAALTALFGAPLLYGVLWLMEAMGARWWLYVWLFWMGFNLLMLLIYPTWIAPLFNRFTPLDDPALRTRIEALLARCGFAASGLFVMDGSRRSAHGNAYFTGFGKTKRIVFFDTLLSRLSVGEVEAVLAHELGHFHHRHVAKRVAMMAASSLVLLWILGWLLDQAWFFAAFGDAQAGTAMGLLLFSMLLPVVLFPLTPLSSGLSRRHEFEADAYAAKQASAQELASALTKLYRDNAATLTPDPLHSLFHDSHPPASARIARLGSTGGDGHLAAA